MKLLYCDKCKKTNEVRIEKINQEFNVKGITIQAEIKIPICCACNEEIWDEKLEKENEKIVFSKYRKKENLLQPEEIESIRKKYGLSQVSFAKILGFGEKTITRYENGSIQDVCHDNLMRLMDSVDSFGLLWKERKYVLTKKENIKISEILEDHKSKKFQMSYIILPQFDTITNASNSNEPYNKGGYKNVG